MTGSPPTLTLAEEHHRDICLNRDKLRRAGNERDARTVERMIDHVAECHRLGLVQEATEVVCGVVAFTVMTLP